MVRQWIAARAKVDIVLPVVYVALFRLHGRGIGQILGCAVQKSLPRRSSLIYMPRHLQFCRIARLDRLRDVRRPRGTVSFRQPVLADDISFSLHLLHWDKLAASASFGRILAPLQHSGKGWALFSFLPGGGAHTCQGGYQTCDVSGRDIVPIRFSSRLVLTSQTDWCCEPGLPRPSLVAVI